MTTDPEEDTEGEAAEGSGEVTLPCDFNTFIMSLATSVMINLGKPGADGVIAPVNLPMAKHSIEILALIEEKTAGNLSGSEERLLSQLLYDLRMHFGTAVKPAG
jgi:hypothetical protein